MTFAIPQSKPGELEDYPEGHLHPWEGCQLHAGKIGEVGLLVWSDGSSRGKQVFQCLKKLIIVLQSLLLLRTKLRCNMFIGRGGEGSGTLDQVEGIIVFLLS